jgi:hypothetical protein
MRFIIEPILTEERFSQAQWVRRQVFEKELDLRPPALEFGTPPQVLHLICRAEPGGLPVAAMSVRDTSGQHSLHNRHGLFFAPGAKVARYTQFAVMKDFRGLHLHLAMLLEANFAFTAPGGYEYSWMVIGARERTPSFCRLLGYVAAPELVVGDLGPSWVMLKDEVLQSARSAEHKCFVNPKTIFTRPLVSRYDGDSKGPGPWASNRIQNFDYPASIQYGETD